MEADRDLKSPGLPELLPHKESALQPYEASLGASDSSKHQHPVAAPVVFSLQVDLSEEKALKAEDTALLHVDLSESKASRLPRWSRHETLVLIEAKKEGEARVKKPKEERERDDKNRPVSESKWLFISAVCKKHGVDREANQCRKRWGNLFGDYKRIKEWQSEGKGMESFWGMRSDERKENKLPGSFDPEVFESLEEFLGCKTSSTVATITTNAIAEVAVLPAPLGVATAVREREAVFENGRLGSEEGLVSDIEHPVQEEATPDAARGGAGSSTPDPDSYKQQPTRKEEAYKEQLPTHSNGRKKRKRPPSIVESDQPKDQLVAALEKNCKVLSEHIEIHNQDRAQRKELVDSLVRVLGKLASALEKISEKLQKHEVGSSS